eukprot:g64363.t1
MEAILAKLSGPRKPSLDMVFDTLAEVGEAVKNPVIAYVTSKEFWAINIGSAMVYMGLRGGKGKVLYLCWLKGRFWDYEAGKHNN